VVAGYTIMFTYEFWWVALASAGRAAWELDCKMDICKAGMEGVRCLDTKLSG
jgi:hypothetical protein